MNLCLQLIKGFQRLYHSVIDINMCAVIYHNFVKSQHWHTQTHWMLFYFISSVVTQFDAGTLRCYRERRINYLQRFFHWLERCLKCIRINKYNINFIAFKLIQWLKMWEATVLSLSRQIERNCVMGILNMFNTSLCMQYRGNISSRFSRESYFFKIS